MNQMRRILSARRLSPSIKPPPCFLDRRPFSTSETDASSALLSSPHQNIQTHEDGASDKSRSTKTTSLKEHELAKFSAIADTWFVVRFFFYNSNDSLVLSDYRSFISRKTIKRLVCLEHLQTFIYWIEVGS